MSDWSQKILAGDLRALARAATAVENRRPEAETLLQELFPNTGKSKIVGITGSPGAGKSTLVDRFIRELRSENKAVGVLAVDPTSPFTGGAILGDRIRMQAHATDGGVFIRSLATRGSLGGLSRSTGDCIRVMDAMGQDVVLVETVGVGQDEVEIVKAADVSVVVLVPGMGDDIQAIKAGIMEIGDIFVINKADRDGVFATEKELEALLTLGPRENSWQPPIVKTVATESRGLEELATILDEVRQGLICRCGSHPQILADASAPAF